MTDSKVVGVANALGNLLGLNVCFTGFTNCLKSSFNKILDVVSVMTGHVSASEFSSSASVISIRGASFTTSGFLASDVDDAFWTDMGGRTWLWLLLLGIERTTENSKSESGVKIVQH